MYSSCLTTVAIMAYVTQSIRFLEKLPPHAEISLILMRPVSNTARPREELKLDVTRKHEREEKKKKKKSINTSRLRSTGRKSQ